MKRALKVNNQLLPIKEFIYIHALKHHGSNIFIDHINDKDYKLTTTGKFESTKDLKSIHIEIINKKHKTGILTFNYLNGAEESHQVKVVPVDRKDPLWITQQRAMYTTLINPNMMNDSNQIEIIFERED